MKTKQVYKAIIAIAVAMAFVMPVAAVTNIGTRGVISNDENTSDIKNIVETSTNNDISDNKEIAGDTEKFYSVIVSTRGRGGTIYVDDDADPGWYNETQVKTIQEGVDNATIGDTVYVYNGIYFETVLVNKTVDLIGESRENVIVDGGVSGVVLSVTVNNVSIDSLSVTKGSPRGIFLTGSSGSSIINCDVYNNTGALYYGQGIYLSSSNDNSVINCNVYNNSDAGIRTTGALDSNIINCNVYNNGVHGIFVFTGSSNNITNCDVYDNNGNGIYIHSNTYDNRVTNCDVYNNGDITSSYGFYYGIYFWQTTNNILTGNTIYDNVVDFAVKSDISVSDYQHVIDPSNTVNGKPIYYLVGQADITIDETNNFGYLALISCTNITAKNSDVYGMLVIDTTDSTISNVNSHDSLWGIYLSFASSNNLIINCDTYNNMYGIYFYQSCSDNIIINSDIYNNLFYGIYIYSTSNNDISDCNIYNNDEYGLYITGSSNCDLIDNTIYDNAFNFEIVGGYYHYIDTSNTINGKPIYWLIGQENITLDETNNIGYLALIDCLNITVENSDVYGILLINTHASTISNVNSHNSGVGIKVETGWYNNIINCDVYDNSAGILLTGCSFNNVTNCDAYNNDGIGIELAGSPDNNIKNCNAYNNNGNGIVARVTATRTNIIYCNAYNNENGIAISMTGATHISYSNIYNNSMNGISLGMAGNNNIIEYNNITNNVINGILVGMQSKWSTVHHNNFINNGQNAKKGGFGASCTWHDGSEGNYWDDYTGIDADGDGIGDTPYAIAGLGSDLYPLMFPWDVIPPVITDVQATPPIQSVTDPVNITCTVTDNWNLVDTVKVNISGPEGFTLEATMNEGSYWYANIYATVGIYYYFIRANDTQGNIVVSDIYSFIITDIEIPTSSVDPLPAWKTAVPFTVTATAADNTGVANVTLWYRYSSDGMGWTEWTSYGIDEGAPWSWSFTGSDGFYEFYSIAIDDFENVEAPPTVADATTGIDRVNPVTICILDGTIGENDWFTSDVMVTLSATDDTSGIESTWYRVDSGSWTLYSVPFTVSDEGQHTIQYYSFDIAEHLEDTNSASFEIDKTMPATEHEFDGVIGDEGWFVSDVTVTLSAADAMSGVNYTMYKLNDGDWMTYVEPFVVTEDDDHTLYYYSVDLAGNVESTDDVEFKIEHDVLPPVTTHEFDGISGDNDWFTSNVAVILSAEDDSAGVDYTMYKVDDGAWTEYTGSFLVTEDGEHTIMYYSVDKVGNEEDEKGPFDFKIDQTPPTIELTWDEENSKLVADVDDETSGVAKVEFYVNGELLGEVTTSPYEWEVSDPQSGDVGQAIVYDNAGNDEISAEINAVSQSQSPHSSPVSRLLSRLFGLW